MRVAAFDGLRGVAILLVVGFHGGWPGFGWGDRGVDLFFALSGYLIATRLAAERESAGRVELGAFLARRARRLVPALAGLLAGYALLCILVFREFLPRLPASLLAAATFTTNVAQAWLGADSLLPHTWALALEVQFYLVCGVLAVRLGRRGLTAATLVALALAPAARAALLLHGAAPDAARLALAPETRIDSIFWGCALGLLWPPAGGGAGGGWRPGRWTQVAALLVFGGVCAAALAWPAWRAGAGYSLIASAAAALVAAIPGAPAHAVARALRAAPLRALGAISYPLFLWHPACLGLAGRVAARAPAGWEGLARQAAYVALSIAAAAASHRLVEQPLARRRLQCP